MLAKKPRGLPAGMAVKGLASGPEDTRAGATRPVAGLPFLFCRNKAPWPRGPESSETGSF